MDYHAVLALLESLLLLLLLLLMVLMKIYLFVPSETDSSTLTIQVPSVSAWWISNRISVAQGVV